MRRLVPAIAMLAVVVACSPTGTGGTTTPPTTPPTTDLTGGTLPFPDLATPIVTDFQIGEVEDGVYIGFIQAASTNGLSGGPEIQFDLAVWFESDEADRMAADDGEESPRPNGYYIRNLDPSQLLIKVSDEVTVSSIWFNYDEPELVSQPITFDQFVQAMSGGTMVPAMRASPWWITIENGLIVSIDEQYVP